MIDQLFEVLILKSLGITILLLTILLLRPWILKWSNAKIAYGLWLMLPIYLLLPINFVDVTSTGGMMTFFLGSKALAVPFVDKNIIAGSNVSIVGMSIWFAGTLAALSLFAFKYKKLKKSLNSLDAEIFSKELDKKIQKKLNNLELVKSDLIDVPAIFGLLTSYLILPKNFAQLAVQSQKMILNHELYHLGRHDHHFNFLRMFIKSVFWFNPIFYWADKYCEADQEISCDLGVLQGSKSENRLIYAKVLLGSITANSRGNSRNKLVSQWKYQSLIQERVKMLKHVSSKKWHSWVAAFFAVSAVWGTSSLVMAEKEEVANTGAIPLSVIQPRYPKKAAEEGVEGWVKLRFNVDSKGYPYEVSVIDDMPKGVFVKNAVKAVRQWSFKTEGGQDDIIYTMEFKLADD